MDPKLLQVLVCPVSGGPLVLQREQQELWCAASQLAYPIEDDIPIMLEDQARSLNQEELESLRS